MNFLQFFVWGSWLISLGGYMERGLHFEGGQIGAIFATMGIASIIMPGITGIIADKWFNAERLYGICHLLGAGCLFYASTATDYNQMYWAMLLNLMVYMPTLSLANTVSYNALEQYKCDLVKTSRLSVYGEPSVSFVLCGQWTLPDSKTRVLNFMSEQAQHYFSDCILSLCPHAPCKKSEQNPIVFFRSRCPQPIQKKKDGYLFLFLDVAGCSLANHKYIW